MMMMMLAKVQGMIIQMFWFNETAKPKNMWLTGDVILIPVVESYELSAKYRKTHHHNVIDLISRKIETQYITSQCGTNNIYNSLAEYSNDHSVAR